MIMSYDKSPYKFVCRDCGTEFIGNKEKVMIIGVCGKKEINAKNAEVKILK